MMDQNIALAQLSDTPQLISKGNHFRRQVAFPDPSHRFHELPVLADAKNYGVLAQKIGNLMLDRP